MLKLFTKLFGTKSGRDIKALQPYLANIDVEFKQLTSLSNDALRAKTLALKEYISNKLRTTLETKASIERQANTEKLTDISKLEHLYQEAARLEKLYTEELEEVLMEILPQAFAIVKETARRFKENEQLVLTATDYDRELATRHGYVVIKADKAIWYNQWSAAGNPVTWDIVHYDVQLLGGVILHQGKIAEMATGEGKTLVATLPTFLNALAGKGVHVVTVNDYLAKRDAEWMGPIYQFHGLKVDCIDKYPSHSEERKKAYQADIIYGTNNEFGFDYLRDNMANSPEEVVQRGLHFAIVDEVDSVLIDDARTPLIISGPTDNSDEQTYNLLKPRIQKLYETQKELVNQFLQEAKKEIAAGNEGKGGEALFRAYRGLPKYKPLIKYLSETGIKRILRKTENYYLQDNARMMPEADAPLLFVIEEKNNSIELTEKGLEYITRGEEDAHFFVLPDVGLEIAHIEATPELDEQTKLIQKDALIQDYAVKSQRIHVVSQLLKAYTLFEKDVEYIVVNDKVKIVDEQTGRVLEGRRYSDGLHQAIEAKESVKVERASQTYASITLQNYFRMYHKLAGMTGTAVTESGEFWEIYKLDVVVTPTHKPIIREDRDDKVYKTARGKFQAIIEEITTLAQQNRPVLVGTTSVEISELVSRMLTMRKIKHQVLNAKHHQKEAEIVAEAGKAGTVTIATNMAGRGTDIKLTAEAKAAGGLAIIGTERHESRRVDRQLRGRAGRQGDVGSSQFFVSLEDSLMRLFGSDRIARIMDKMGLKEEEVIQHPMITKSIERAQKKVEQSNFAIRKRLLEYDNVMNAQREVVYKKRKHALLGKRLDLDVMSIIHDTIEDIATHYKDRPEYEPFSKAVFSIFGTDIKLAPKTFNNQKDLEKVVEEIYYQALKLYETRKQKIQTEVYPLIEAFYKVHGSALQNFSLPFAENTTRLYVTADLQACIDSSGEEFIKSLERAIILHCVDQHWKEHLREMDELKQSVQNAVYERQDPLLIYKLESYRLFQQTLQKINKAVVRLLHKSSLQIGRSEEIEAGKHEESHPQLQESKQNVQSLLYTTDEVGSEPSINVTPRGSEKTAKRNQRVTVRYEDGSIKENVKYKTVEEDIANKRCAVIEEI